MPLLHDTMSTVRAAVDLVNSAEEPDTLTSPAAVDEWYDRHHLAGHRGPNGAELTALRAIRAEIRELLTADRDRASALINRTFAAAGAQPRLVRHDDFDWHLHVLPRDESGVHRVVVETAMAMADLLHNNGTSRLATCADGRCNALVLDSTRNRSRRFCRAACANRNAVAAYRERRRG